MLSCLSEPGESNRDTFQKLVKPHRMRLNSFRKYYN